MNVLEGDFKDWDKSGLIAGTALEFGRKMIKPGVRVLDVTLAVEKKIFDMGGELAFPAQINFNEIAAHDCAHHNDDRVFKEEDVIKLDCGTTVNGAVGDNAVTVCLNPKYDELAKASKEALQNAIKTAIPGNTTAQIGKVIQETIESYGYKPVRNLCGHGIGIYKYHMAPSIPNIDTGKGVELKEGQTIAIEPFATDGEGLIKEYGDSQVFCMHSKKPVRSLIARNVSSELMKFKNMPFAIRQVVSSKLTENSVKYGLKELQMNGSVTAYPPLREVKGGMVTQFEKSLVVADKPYVLTRSE